MKVTNEMIVAAHGVTLERGDVIISADLLEKIYLAMDAKKSKHEAEPVATVTSKERNPEITMSWWHEPALPVGTSLYTHPPKHEAEPVAWTIESNGFLFMAEGGTVKEDVERNFNKNWSDEWCNARVVDLYTTPPTVAAAVAAFKMKAVEVCEKRHASEELINDILAIG